VVGLEEGTIYLDVGEADGLLSEMKLLLYRQGPFGKQSIKYDDKQVEARVANLEPNSSSGKLTDKKAFNILQIGDKVIAK